MEGKRGNYYCNSRHQSPSWGGNCLLKNVSWQYILFSLGKMRSQGLIRKQTPNLLCLWHRIKGLLTSHTGKVMLKILQARLQQYANRELPDVHVGFRKGRGTRDQIANICWIMEKARVLEKHLFLLYWLCQSLWLYGSQSTVENSERDGNTRPSDLPLKKRVCRSGSNS